MNQPRSRGAGLAADTGERRFRYAVVAAFAVLQLVLLDFHEPWRDELNLWLIARDVPDFGAFWDILDHGGHGRLWHSGVWLLARLTEDVLAARLLQAIIATAGVAVFVRFAPFGKPYRALFPLGYFPLFEYGAIARPYGLGMLLLFAACAAWSTRPRRPVRLAALLGLLANTTVYGVFASVGMAVAWSTAHRRALRAGSESAPSRQSLAAAAGLLLALLGAALVHMHPAATATFSSEWHLGWEPERAVGALRASHAAVAPLLPLRREFRNAHVLDAWPTLSAGLGAALVVGTALLFWPQIPALALWLGTSAVTAAFTYAKGPHAARHMGVLFLVWVASAWLAEIDPARARHRRARRAALAAVLVLHAAAGLQALAFDIRFPFSASRAAGSWLRENVPPDRPLIGHPHPMLSPVAYWAGRPFWSAEWNGPATYHYFHSGALAPERDAVVEAALDLANRDGREAYLVFTRPRRKLPPDSELVARFDQAILPSERYFVYRIPAAAQ